MHSKRLLPPHFRKLSYMERKRAIQAYFDLTNEQIDSISGKLDLSDLADVLVETSIGTLPIPFGLATGFVINGEEKIIPMATEEPSVIAAGSFGAMLARSGGGFQAEADAPLMTAQIFIYDAAQNAIEKIQQSKNEIHHAVNALIPAMVDRGGGFRGLTIEKLSDGTFCVNIHLDVREAMGANVANNVAEGMKERIAELSSGKVLMAIFTNAAEKRLARASLQIPAKYFRKGKLAGEEVCRRIVMATEIANAYPSRAVTHNKGIMNGISALTLATGNDTRAVEAAAHYHAQREGAYQSLTSFTFEDGILHGSIELPMPLGTVGGSISIWPPSNVSLKILGNPDTQTLCGIAASVGLAQNLAAITALVSEGIQRGHMKLHAARIAYAVGARGNEIRTLAVKLSETQAFNQEKAQALYNVMKRQS